MNKKVFLGLFAATGMLLATSCSQDELEVPQSGNEAQVTFTLGLEGGHATRAISDGSGVDKLVYAVYKLSATDGVYELQPAVGSTNSQFVKDDFKSGDNVSIPLAKGQTYRVAFWAQNSKCNAYNTADLTNVSVNYAADGGLNNDETRDAFFKTVEFTVDGSKTIDVVLNRPFAQINVGVTAEDWEAAIASGIEIERSAVKINNAATAINLLTGEVEGEQTVEYGLDIIPAQFTTPETLNVDLNNDGIKENYVYLSMSYILANDATTGYAKTIVEDMDFTFAPISGNNINFSEGLNAVPVQRNWRTNIIGKILTGDIQFNITVDSVYDDEHNVMVPVSGVVNVESQEEFDDALANAETHTINLGAGTYVADIYNGTPGRKSLTIIGTEGTKFGHKATTGGQLRLDLFENFTIRNCEIIQRSGVKTWGHIVFGSGTKANGVYTIENCKFNGVGTQGIYINENTTGATYNILNCTFDGDFGTEGAITIQTNKNVNHTVNVKGCTFNNIPDTSHRIFLAKSTAGWFYDFTLNTDLKAYSAYDLAMFVALGKTNIDLADGEYDVYGCAGKTLTLNGSVNAVLKLYNDGEDGCDYAFGGNGTGVGDITFNGLTINTESNTGNYKGYAYMKGTFNNCNFVGAYSLNNSNDYTFTNCTFDFKNGYFWTWGANSVTFDRCRFNGNSKNILAHGYASTQITINNCTFAATEVGKTGAGDPTACVEIDPAGTNVYTINFTGTNTKTDKYAGWTRIKDGSTGHTITGVQ